MPHPSRPPILVAPILTSVLLVTLLLSPGCASIANLLGNGPRPFGGIRGSISGPRTRPGLWALNLEGPYPPAIVVVTFPFHLVQDLVLLPVTLVLGYRYDRWWQRDMTADGPSATAPPRPAPPSRKPAQRRPRPVMAPRRPPPGLGLNLELGAEPLRVSAGDVELSISARKPPGESVIRLRIENAGAVTARGLNAAIGREVSFASSIEIVTSELKVGDLLPEQAFERDFNDSPGARLLLVGLGDASEGPFSPSR